MYTTRANTPVVSPQLDQASGAQPLVGESRHWGVRKTVRYRGPRDILPPAGCAALQTDRYICLLCLKEVDISILVICYAMLVIL